jgi:hypothetical protein
MKMTLIFLLSASCSFKSLLVSKLDYFMTDKISDELNLNSEQEDELREDVISFLNQNKTTAKTLIEKVNKFEVNKNLPVDTLKKQYKEFVARLLPILSKYYFKLSIDQRKEFFKYQENKNKEIEKQMNKITVKSVSKKYDGFFGYINDEQKNLIDKSLPLFKNMANVRMKRRINIQQALKKAVTFAQVQAAFAIFSKSLNENSELNNEFLDFINKLLEQTNKDQVETLNEKKIELIQILEYYITNTY